MRSKAKPIVNRYNLSDDLINYDIMNFKEDDELWIKFICNCRKGEEIYKEYDAIIGSVADDNDIINFLAEKQNMDIRLAMDIYYRSLLCKQVHNGENGIQYLDYKYLVEDLLENEKELFM